MHPKQAALHFISIQQSYHLLGADCTSALINLYICLTFRTRDLLLSRIYVEAKPCRFTDRQSTTISFRIRIH